MSEAQNIYSALLHCTLALGKSVKTLKSLRDSLYIIEFNSHHFDNLSNSMVDRKEETLGLTVH